MFDVSRRQFELRKNFKCYGPEDRSRYTYQGDLFNVYSNKNNEFLFKYGFTNECVSENFLDQNSLSLKNKNIKNYKSDINKCFEFLFEDILNNRISDNLAVTAGLQVEQIKENFKGKVILELGPGNSLIAPLFIKNSKQTFTYVVVEAVPQLYVLQQNILKFFSLYHNKFHYCSSLDKFYNTHKNAKKTIVLHLQSWELKSLNLSPDLIIANNVMDQISSLDFLEYFDFLKKSLSQNGKISIWGGLERAGVKDLYLFGFGTYHNHNIIEHFKKSFVLKKFTKIGSEFYCLFDKSKGKSMTSESFIDYEKKLIKKHLPNIDYLWIDDNAQFLNHHQEIFKNTKLKSFTTSVSTEPLPCNVERNNINKLKINPKTKFLVFSYRWIGVKDYFYDKKYNLKISKLTDRTFIMEIIK